MSTEINLHELAEKVIKLGLSLGADQVEAYTIYGAARNVQLERGSIRRFTDVANSGLGIRVIKDKAIGMASTTIFSHESIENTVKDAFSLAKVSPPDENFNSLPEDNRSTPEIKDCFDQNIIDLSVEDFTQMILEGVQEAQVRDDAIIGGSFTAGNGERFIITSQGIDRFSKQTSITGYLSVKLQDGEDIGNAYYFDSSKVLADFDHIVVGKEAGKRAVNMLGSQKIESATLPILLDPDGSMGTIAPIISSGINAFNVFNRTAYFVDKIGDAIASDNLTITDDPFYPGGVDSSAFDDEGVIPNKLELVKDGILNTYITDSYTAPLVGLENTGHASRGSFATRPKPSTYSLDIKAGETAKDTLLEDLKEGILLIGSSIVDMSGNPQISAQINQGFYVKGGEIQYPVKNAMIGTTVFEVFEKIEDFSKEQQNRHGHKSPWMLLSPLQVSGGK
ncbi:MAG: TldD/PmbA family protein [Candidatus Heimdallarchaeaceae archaeon]